MASEIIQIALIAGSSQRILKDFFFQNKWMFSIPAHFEKKIVEGFVEIGVLQNKSFKYTYTCNTLEQMKVRIFGFRFYAL